MQTKLSALDLAKAMTSFNVDTLPVILRPTEKFQDISSDIVAFHITAFGGVKLSDKMGALELLSELLTKGTYSYSKEEINKILVRTGASLHIDAGYDAFTVQLKCLKKFLPELLPMLSEIVRVPLLDPKEIELSKQQLITSLQRELQHPDTRLQLRAHQLFFENHPYSIRPSGYLETVPQITREDLSAAFFRTFNKSNVLFVVIGQLSPNETKELISKYFSSLPTGNRAPEVTETPQNKVGVHFEKFEGATNYFLARFKAPSLDHSDYPALAIALQILDNRLFEEIRTKRALTYSVRASMGNSRINTGYIYVTSTKLAEAVELIFEEVKKLQVEPASEELLKLQVNKFLSGWYLSRETRSSQASIFALYEVFGIGWENADFFISRLERVKPEDIQRVMKTYLKDLTYVVLGPESVDLQPALSRLGFLPTDPKSLMTK